MAEEEKEENQTAKSQENVIDIDAFVKPISEESPAGESLRYVGTYDEINEARHEDDPLLIGDSTALKRADHKAVIRIASDAIQNKSKDLQIGAWLTISLIREHGWAGLRDGFQLLKVLQDNYWENLFPLIDEGDMEARANALDWVSDEGAFALRWAPITNAGIGYNGIEDSQIFDIPDDIDSLSSEDAAKAKALKEQAEKEDRVTSREWEKAVKASNRAYFEELAVTIQETKDAYDALNESVENNFDPNQAPAMRSIKSQMETIEREVSKLLEQKRLEEPDPEEIEETDPISGERIGGKSKGDSTGAINSRSDALKRLSQLAVYFKKTEPHSPVSYLVDRAVKWGNMPLDSWLQDVIKDENILGQIRQTLGFNTDGSASDASGSSNFDSSTSNDGNSGDDFLPMQ